MCSFVPKDRDGNPIRLAWPRNLTTMLDPAAPLSPRESVPPSNWLSPRQVATLVGVTPRTVRRWCEAGWLDHRRIGPGRRVKVAAQVAMRLTEQGPFPPTTAPTVPVCSHR
jgi:excisionase family DNA binding protein